VNSPRDGEFLRRQRVARAEPWRCGPLVEVDQNKRPFRRVRTPPGRGGSWRQPGLVGRLDYAPPAAASLMPLLKGSGMSANESTIGTHPGPNSTEGARTIPDIARPLIRGHIGVPPRPAAWEAHRAGSFLQTHAAARPPQKWQRSGMDRDRSPLDGGRPWPDGPEPV
jgi:hypothetical protein